MAYQWYYLRDGQKSGPFPSSVLVQMAKKGELLPTDHLWKEGMKSWRRATDFPKLFKEDAVASRGSTRPTTGANVAREKEPSGDHAATPPQGRSVAPSGESSAAPSSLDGLTTALGIERAKPGRDPLLGCDIGGVTIVRLIAEGGMGRVYEGKQEKPNRVVAVKVMRPGLTSPSVLKRFEYEAEVLGRLQHPGIAHIYSVGVHKVGAATVPYFVMEYVPGAKSLTAYAEELKLPMRQRLDLFRSVCDAVAHGHQKGVIHRDLKPGNILVDASGQPKVIDFGVARATDSDMALTTMQTDVGQLIGTLQYMSPEQFKADPNDIDVRSDVYALGVILYELLAGKMPYDVKKKAIHEVARIVQEDDPTPLSSFNRGLKGDVAVIASKCLEKERGRRYSSASELGADVGRYLSGDPIAASPPGFVDGIIRLAKKHRAAATAVAATVICLVTALTVVAWSYLRSERLLKLTNAARILAEEASAEADAQRNVAESERRKADAEATRANRQSYLATISQLAQAVRDYQCDQLGDLLARAQTAFKAGYGHSSPEPFELRLLKPLMDTSLLTLESDDGSIDALSVSPDGTRVATASLLSTNVALWDSETGTIVKVLLGHSAAITGLTFTPDGRLLATASGDGSIRLWNAQTGDSRGVLKSDTDGILSIYSVAFSPDGKHLAAARGNSIDMWSVAQQSQLESLDGHAGVILKCIFSPSGKHLLTGSSDGTARLWDIATGKHTIVYSPFSGAEPIRLFAFSESGHRIAAAGKNAVVWDVPDSRVITLIPSGLGNTVTSLALSPDGSRLALGTYQETVGVWDATTGEKMYDLADHEEYVTAIAFDPTSQHLVTGSRDRKARRFRADDGALQETYMGHADGITSLAFFAGGKRFVTAAQDGTSRVWTTIAGDSPTLLDGAGAEDTDDTSRPELHKGGRSEPLDAMVGLSDLKCTSDGNYVAALDALSFTRTAVQIWDMRTLRTYARVEYDRQQPVGSDAIATIASFDFNTPQKVLAAGTDDGQLQLFSLVTKTSERLVHVHDGPVWAVRFSPDGQRCATAGGDGVLRLWEANSLKSVAAFRDQVTAPSLLGKGVPLAFSPDSKTLATASKDGRISLWDACDGKSVGTLSGPKAGCDSLTFSPDGSRLGGTSSSVPRGSSVVSWQGWLWNLETKALVSPLTLPEGDPVTLKFSGDSKWCVTAGRTMLLWDAVTGELKRALRGARSAVAALAVTADGRRFATAHRDDSICVWDPAGGDLLLKRRSDARSVSTLEFTDGDNVLVCCGNKRVAIYGRSNESLIDTGTNRARKRNTAWASHPDSTTTDTDASAGRADTAPPIRRVTDTTPVGHLPPWLPVKAGHSCWFLVQEGAAGEQRETIVHADLVSASTDTDGYTACVVFTTADAEWGQQIPCELKWTKSILTFDFSTIRATVTNVLAKNAGGDLLTATFARKRDERGESPGVAGNAPQLLFRVAPLEKEAAAEATPGEHRVVLMMQAKEPEKARLVLSSPNGAELIEYSNGIARFAARPVSEDEMLKTVCKRMASALAKYTEQQIDAELEESRVHGDSTEGPRDALERAIKVLKAGGQVAFFATVVAPPATIALANENNRMELMSDHGSTQLLSVLQAAARQEPDISGNGKRATFKYDDTNGMQQEIVFVRLGERWYLFFEKREAK